MFLRLEDGLLVIDSRLKSLPTQDEAYKTRALLDDRHHTVRLLVAHYHRKANHGFSELVFNELRQKFWILRGRRAVKTPVMECLECKRRKSQPRQPRFGDLPRERLEHHTRPFTVIGLDYFGLVIVSIGRRHEKRWVALYFCLVTRALHLEVVASLSSSSAILNLRRFFSRRGCPNIIVSDNNTSFVGASRELAVLFATLMQDLK
jgi:hypothetical protein